MNDIVVDERQAKLIAESRDVVEIRDPQGRCVGYVSHGFGEEDIAEARRRLASDEPRYTTQEVLESLAATA